MTASVEKIHLVGIGGAGMSAIARVLVQKGCRVTGSDVRDSPVLDALRSVGISTSVGHRADNVADADRLIVSAAVPDSNPEVVLARQRGLPVISRGEALAQIVSRHRVIAISGTHGKTTTSSMVAAILVSAGEDPTYLLGADIEGLGPGGAAGEGELAVVEADEAYGSFLWLRPAISLVTNVDDDHLDHYGGRTGLEDAFRRFLGSCTEKAIVCADDPSALALAPEEVETYGLDNGEIGATEVEVRSDACSFVLRRGDIELGPIQLGVTGRHNVLNALGASAAALAAGLDYAAIAEGLRSFKGVQRRFEPKGSIDGFDLVDDYAHHPAEVEATLAASRQGPWNEVIAVFQPHLYSRTLALKERFGAALSMADVVVVTDVYAAREEPVPGVTGKLIVDEVCRSAPTRRVAYIPDLDAAARFVRSIARPGDLVIGLGAGDITTLPELIRAARA